MPRRSLVEATIRTSGASETSSWGECVDWYGYRMVQLEDEWYVLFMTPWSEEAPSPLQTSQPHDE